MDTVENHERSDESGPDEWLYRKLFAIWEEFRLCVIDEYADSDGKHCRGPIKRSWFGTKPISAAERAEKLKPYERFAILSPLTVVSFHIAPDRKHVLVGYWNGGRDGIGFQYFVEGTGQATKLVQGKPLWRS